MFLVGLQQSFVTIWTLYVCVVASFMDAGTDLTEKVLVLRFKKL